VYPDIPFHCAFDEDLPSFDDQVRVLKSLTWQPKVIEAGGVNPTNGLIYRYSVSFWWRAFSVLVIIAVLSAIILGLSWRESVLKQYIGDLNTEGPSYLILWGALLGGMIFHIAVATQKCLQTQLDSPPIFAFYRFLPLLNAHLGLYLFKLLLSLIGFFGLVMGLATTTSFNAFLVGYSLNSIVELFGTSVAQRATVQTAVLNKQLGISGQ
jgi:hypothetical protein